MAYIFFETYFRYLLLIFAHPPHSKISIVTVNILGVFVAVEGLLYSVQLTLILLTFLGRTFLALLAMLMSENPVSMHIFVSACLLQIAFIFHCIHWDGEQAAPEQDGSLYSSCWLSHCHSALSSVLFTHNGSGNMPRT